MVLNFVFNYSRFNSLEEIVDLTRQCEDLKEENQAHKELCQQEIDRAKDNLQSNERKLEEYRSKEKNLEQVEIRVKANNSKHLNNYE